MSEEKYNAIGQSFTATHQAEISKLFGKPCLKFNGRAFVCYYNGDMVFRLNAEPHKTAFALKGSKLFDPSGLNRPMMDWVQVKPAHETEWNVLAEAAMEFVKGKPRQ